MNCVASPDEARHNADGKRFRQPTIRYKPDSETSTCDELDEDLDGVSLAKDCNREIQRFFLITVSTWFLFCLPQLDLDKVLSTDSSSQGTEGTSKLENEETICMRRNGDVHLEKKDSIFLKELATAIFGDDILMNSSICGMASNRKKGEAVKPALDPTKLLAMQDLLKHRLNEREVLPEEQIKINMRMDHIINEKKIQGLRRPPRINKKKTLKDNTVANETEIVIGQDLMIFDVENLDLGMYYIHLMQKRQYHF
ncbi:hypothetical protein RN001_005811 [Aquatica leii]|uniref:BEN domain-containing protein n=1 Tax=Aquatica leii TaxID=1421715 RepID=A0AAN7PCC4_9COLE|nr:hypothetical protein RN001_005811 [Aquatica leii]